MEEMEQTGVLVLLEGDGQALSSSEREDLCKLPAEGQRCLHQRAQTKEAVLLSPVQSH